MATTVNTFILARGLEEAPTLSRDRNQLSHRRESSTSGRRAIAKATMANTFNGIRIPTNTNTEKVPSMNLDNRMTQQMYQSHACDQDDDGTQMANLDFQHRMHRDTPRRAISNRGNQKNILESIYNAVKTVNTTLPLFLDGSGAPDISVNRNNVNSLGFGRSSEHAQAQSCLAHKVMSNRQVAMDIQPFSHMHSRMSQGKKFSKSYFAAGNLGPL